jgi:fucose permease
LLNMAGFLAVRLPPFVHESQRERTRVMARTRLFWLALFGILLAGATEVTLAQWTSAFAQAALGLSQGVADCVGFGLFGAMMVVGRLWFGFRGHTRPLRPLLIAGALCSVVCYLVAALCPWPPAALVACIVAGLAVSMLWPGIVSLSAAAFPKAGVSLFALLAAFGDTGAGVGPWLVGAVADAVAAMQRAGSTLWAQFLPTGLAPAQTGLRVGLLVVGLCPLALAVLFAAMRKPRPEASADALGGAPGSLRP